MFGGRLRPGVGPGWGVSGARPLPVRVFLGVQRLPCGTDMGGRVHRRVSGTLPGPLTRHGWESWWDLGTPSFVVAAPGFANPTAVSGGLCGWRWKGRKGRRG